MAIYINEDRFYQEVDKFKEAEKTYIIPNGKKLFITTIGADVPQFNSNANNGDTRALVIWDEGGAEEEIIMCAYQSVKHPITKEFSGDGVKEIKIKLVNRNPHDAILGAYWMGNIN